ncbi:hypothetical protein JCM19239_7238 [Vibrio variabilis]|uniref:Uncharacterized protein n=1 Tax=Vibrio variabilis TaxID=990271 RepID=A0ABQ0J789_9VIBR|nr:hypothetical protein JCM19239_7238 [Vibrio variabilis]
MHHFLKPLLVTLALAGATTPFSISADTIRLTGPNGEVISLRNIHSRYAKPSRQSLTRLRVTMDQRGQTKPYGQSQVDLSQQMRVFNKQSMRFTS